MANRLHRTKSPWGRAVYVILARQGVSRASLARKIGVSNNAVGDRLRTPSPTLATLKEMAAALGVTLSQLIVAIGHEESLLLRGVWT